MTTVIPGLFQINGVVSTDKSVLQNINAICTAAGCWMTYDITEGKWSVIMNRAGSSVASFNDSNIIGGINVSGKGISELYNSVTIEFPHKDLRDQTDYIDFDIAANKRFPNELDNKLNLSTDLANDPIQAQYIAGAELKQSRVDKVIQFRTDFSMLGLKAGDLIDVTAEMYGYTNKVFRITRLEEDDSEVLELSITALEYDADVYSTADLTRKIRSKKTGITPKAANQTLTGLDNKNGLVGLNGGLGDLANANLLASIMSLLGGRLDTALSLTQAAKDQGLSLYRGANTWVIDFGGKKVTIAASDVVISWTFTTGVDLDIRCRIVSPSVGQNTVNDSLGYTGSDPGGGGSIPPYSLDVWPVGATKGSAGTAYIEWGGDNQGAGKETVRVDIDRLKTVFPTKRYFVIECRGNWYSTRGSTQVLLQATLYEGGTTTATGESLVTGTPPTQTGFTSTGAVAYNFVNVGATRTRVLDGVGVFVDSLSTNPNVGGDLMGYFIFDTQNNTAQFTLEVPPEALT